MHVLETFVKLKLILLAVMENQRAFSPRGASALLGRRMRKRKAGAL